MHVESPTTDAAPALADLWVDLAREQRQYDSHLLPAENRARIEDNIVRSVVADDVRIAVPDPDDEWVETGDAILGFVTFGLGTEVYRTDDARGRIENIYVRPPYRDRGVGEALLSAAESVMAGRGVETVRLDVMAANERARRFYRRHGYEPHRVAMERSVRSDTHSKDGGK